MTSFWCLYSSFWTNFTIFSSSFIVEFQQENVCRIGPVYVIQIGSSRQFPVNIYLFKGNNRNTRKTCEICSKSTIKTPERTYFAPFSSVSIVDFERVKVNWVENFIETLSFNKWFLRDLWISFQFGVLFVFGSHIQKASCVFFKILKIIIIPRAATPHPCNIYRLFLKWFAKFFFIFSRKILRKM